MFIKHYLGYSETLESNSWIKQKERYYIKILVLFIIIYTKTNEKIYKI